MRNWLYGLVFSFLVIGCAEGDDAEKDTTIVPTTTEIRLEERSSSYIAIEPEKTLYREVLIGSERTAQTVDDILADKVVKEMPPFAYLSHAAVSGLLGENVEVSVRGVISEEQGEMVVTRELKSLDTSKFSLSRVEVSKEKNTEEIQQLIEYQLGRDNFERSDSGDPIIYVRFSPEVPVEIKKKVQWLNYESGEKMEDKLKEIENSRAIEIDRLLTKSLKKMIVDFPKCELLYKSRIDHAATLVCPEGELSRMVRTSYVIQIALQEKEELNMFGDDHRGVFGSQSNEFLLNGYDGEIGSNINVAVVDKTGFYGAPAHPAYIDYANGPSRITKYKFGSSSGGTYQWVNAPTFGGDPVAHGARILGAMADTTDGQDTSLTQAQREDSSHGAFEANLALYWGATSQGIEKAALDGADLISLSISAGKCGDYSLVPQTAAAWDLAHQMGSLGVLCAKNWSSRYSDECAANGYSSREDLLVIGAFGDNSATLANWDYDTEPLMGNSNTNFAGADNCPTRPPGETGCWGSAIGDAGIRFSNGVVRESRSLIDLTAPSGRSSSPWVDAANNPVYGPRCCGTSNSTPTAAAMLVGLLDWAKDSGHWEKDPSRSEVVALLYGDGTGGGHNPGAAPQSTITGSDRLWGFGRMKARLFTSVGLDGPAAWGVASYYVYPGSTIDRVVGGDPLSSDVEFFEWALTWDEPHLTHKNTNEFVADITAEVLYNSPVNGECVSPASIGAQVLLGDYSFDTKKHIVIREPEINTLHNQCVWMRTTAASVPADDNGYTRRLVYSADFWEDLDR